MNESTPHVLVKTASSYPRHVARSKGFTLLELLAVIATIGALAAMLLPVLGKAKAKAQQATCVYNLHQLGLAWQLYHMDNGGRLVESYPINNPYVWVLGDMRNPAEATDKRLIEAGKLYSYHGNTTGYRCPTDRGTVVEGNKRVQNARSYAMNSFMGGRDPSIGPIPTTASKYVPFFAKDTDLSVRRPSELWVLIDEDERSINDGVFVTDPGARIWFDLPTISPYRHRYSYGLNFADGHSESWSLRDERSSIVERNETEQAGNKDLERLARATTVLR